MQAKVTVPFNGKPDDEILPKAFKIGDAVTGDLAKVAVREKWATGEDLGSLTVAELKELAAERSVDLGDSTKKADIIAALELAAEASA